MEARIPNQAKHSRERQEPMAFEWRRCAAHPWLQASILLGPGFEPRCFLEDGSTHPVGGDELDRAA